jgi:hypothetical protein
MILKVLLLILINENKNLNYIMNIPNGGFPPLIICYDDINKNELNKILKTNKNTVLNMKNIINNNNNNKKNDIIVKVDDELDELEEI